MSMCFQYVHMYIVCMHVLIELTHFLCIVMHCSQHHLQYKYTVEHSLWAIPISLNIHHLHSLLSVLRGQHQGSCSSRRAG